MATAAQVARQRNHYKNPKEIKVGPEVTSKPTLTLLGNQPAMLMIIAYTTLII